ncbi:hypothetical protein I312_100172 [Cryptococcus bacillisporus CA1280]|uniref:uncharacterized protein n=1 Tax=Cryptococcus bacillisporus CA1280 TaxID=1296109 RepID=UPI003366A077
MLTQVSHTNGHLLTPFRALLQTEEEISTSQFHTSDLYASSQTSDEEAGSRSCSSTTDLVKLLIAIRESDRF